MKEAILINKDNNCEVCLNKYLYGNSARCRCLDATEECVFVEDDILALFKKKKED